MRSRLLQLSLLSVLVFTVACGGGVARTEGTGPGQNDPAHQPGQNLPPGCKVVPSGPEGTMTVACDPPAEQPPEQPAEQPPAEMPPAEMPPAEMPSADAGPADAGTPPSRDAGATDAGSPADVQAPPADLGPPPPPPPVCASQTLAPDRAPAPNLLLTVDHSQSMTYPPGDGSSQSKWAQLSSAIDQVVPAVDQQVRWGLAYFPIGTSTCGAGTVAVEVGDSKGQAVVAGLQSIGPPTHGGTPTAATLQLLLGHDALYDPSRPSFVLLATDGRPTCKNGDFDDITGADDQATRDAVTALRDAGIRTFVIGFGTDVNTTNAPLLTDLAVLGGTDRQGGVAYYNASSLSDLQQALHAIGASAQCTYNLNDVPSDPASLQVSFDGTPVANDPANGWQFDSAANTIAFSGTACDAIAAGQVAQIGIDNICP